jgi:uncharacterized Zn finger protein (UPF0148 family)
MTTRICRDCRIPLLADEERYGICGTCEWAREGRLAQDAQQQREIAERIRLTQLAQRSTP